MLESVKQGKCPQDWTLDELQSFAPEFDEETLTAMVPQKALENHAVPGGTAKDSVARALASASRDLQELKEQIALS